MLLLLQYHKKFFTRSLLAAIILFSAFTSNAQTYVFAQLTGAPMNTTGWNLQGAATVTNVLNNNNSELLLVSNSNTLSGAVFYNQPINLSVCNKWKAEFDFRINDGSGADGLAFCFLDVPPVGFVTGAGLGIPQSANGLKICFDTYNNCLTNHSQNVPKVEIRWGPGYDECANMPTADNASGNLSFIRSLTYNHALINYDNGNITVSVNGQQIVSGFQQFNFSGYLGFTASTGGQNDNHSIKNVIIYTDMPPSVANNVSTAPSVCANTFIQLGSTTNTNYVYSWTPTTGLDDATKSNPFLKLDNTSDSLQSFKYYVKTAFANNPGCSSIDSVLVAIHPRPKINFITPAICLNDAVAKFTDSSYSKDLASYPFKYHWFFDDATNSNNLNPDTSILQNPSHKYARADYYNVKLTVTSNENCIDSVTKIFTVNGSVPKASFSIINSSQLCSNQKVQIQDYSTVDFGNVTKTEIYWDYLNQPSLVETDNAPSKNKMYSHSYLNFSSPSTKIITIRYVVYSGTTCINETTNVITLLASPHVVFNTIPSVCDNNNLFQITEATEISSANGQYTFSGMGVSASGIFNPAISGAGTFSILYSFTSNNGCIDTASQTITVWPHPNVSAGSEILILDGDSTIINATAIGNQLSYLWQPNIYLNKDTLLNPVITPHQNTWYKITVTDIHSCSNSDSLFVKVLMMPKVPNVFSPNGDGINDKWEIKYLSDYPECSVRVFTRTGQLVFESTGYATAWDGTLNGQALPIGTYYYIIQPHRGRGTISGSVTIIR